MPLDLVNPIVQPQGAGIPNSPLVNAFGNAFGVINGRYPTALEKADIAYKGAETNKVNQELQGNNALAGIIRQALTPQNVPDPGKPPVEGPRPDANFMGPEPSVPATRQQTPDEAVRGALPDLVTALAQGNKVQNSPQLARMVAAFVPGAAADIQNAPMGKPSGMDMAMLGAGDSYESTPGGFKEKNQMGFTGEQKNIRAKMDNLKNMYGLSDSDAYSLAAGITKTVPGLDGQMYLVNEASGTSKKLTPGPQGMPGQSAPAGAPDNAPLAPPTVGPKPMNNPGNLRPVGDANNFMQFSTPQQGMTALQNDLSAKLSGNSKAMAGKTPTIANIISTYSPPSENATTTLIANAAKRMGRDPNAPLTPADMPALTQAILAQEQGGTGGITTAGGMAAVAPVTFPPSQGAPAAGFKLQPNALGVDYSSIYGGSLNGGVANRAAGELSQLLSGGTSGGATSTDLDRLKGVNSALAEIESMHMGNQRGNVAEQTRLLTAYPSTDQNVLQNPTDVMLTQGTRPPDDIQAFYDGKLKDALQWRQQAAAGLQNAANKDQYEHYTSLISNIDQMFSKALPADQYNAYAKSVGAAPIPSAPTVAPMTNREAGAALTAPEDAIPVVHSKAEAVKKEPGSLFRDSTGVVWFVEGPGQFKRVNGK